MDSFPFWIKGPAVNCENEYWKVLEYRGAVVVGAYMTSECSQSFIYFFKIKVDLLKTSHSWNSWWVSFLSWLIEGHSFPQVTSGWGNSIGWAHSLFKSKSRGSVVPCSEAHRRHVNINISRHHPLRCYLENFKWRSQIDISRSSKITYQCSWYICTLWEPTVIFLNADEGVSHWI